ncbi:MAG: glycoside hydrolase family 3 N-terminal domain-containing protein [Planctomycetota bacterium]
MTATASQAVYRDPSRPTDERVADLLRLMTLEEKIAQMQCVWNDKQTTLLDAEGRFDAAKANKAFGHGRGIGQVGRPGDSHGGARPKEFAELTNAIQRFFVENSRLGIPVLFHDECLHGHVARDATSFAQPIGLASTFNPELVERMYAMAAREARASGVHQALGPVLDVARDPRWGRVEETFGEDPHLVGEMGLAAVRGLQGDRQVNEPDRVIATLKHFAAHGQPESGTNCAPVSVSERHLRETFLAPFEKAIAHGGAMSVMASYNEIDGVPSHASQWLLRKVLREEWGFEGTVVSDYYAITELHDRPGLFGHHVTADREGAAVMAALAGVNIELPEPECYLHLAEAVHKGLLAESVIDELVSALLAQKFELGLFETPYVDPSVAEATAGCESHKSLALEAARQVITLLKNDDGVLPLDPSGAKRIAVIGPNADRALLGGYSGKPSHVTTVLEGLRAFVGDTIEIVHAEGCAITVGGSWEEDAVTLSDPVDDRQKMAAAVALAEQADMIIYVGGGNEQTSREAWFTNHMGDRTDLGLVGLQDELLDALASTGKPIVSVLFNGRPLVIENLAERSAAVLECWYLGQEGGAAVADVLFGEVSPSGKLPITVPRSVGHLPAFYNHRPSARRGYLFDDISPLYPFGFGLSYSEFEFAPPTLSSDTIGVGESTVVRVEVTNVGDREATETVQVYVRDVMSSVTRPVLELKGFQRLTIAAGETRTAEITLGPEQLAFWNLDKRFVVEPGEFEILVGPDSQRLQTTGLSVNA